MKITSIVAYFGGKRRMAHDIVRQLGEHDQYFEPFCGSLAVPFAKDPCAQETVNDLHWDVTNLARVLQRRDSAVALYDRLQNTMVCQGLLDDAQAYLESTELAEENMLERAYHYFLASWMARNGVSGTERMEYQIAVRWTKGGGSPVTRFGNAVESIPDWHRRLLNIVVLCRDAFDIMDRFDDVADTALYVDPPYPPEIRANMGQAAGGGGGRYLHEFKHSAEDLFGERDDHVRLRDALGQYKKARIVLSCYDCERYRRLYDGWMFIDMATKKNLAAQNKRGGGEETPAPEVLIVNGPAYGVAA